MYLFNSWLVSWVNPTSSKKFMRIWTFLASFSKKQETEVDFFEIFKASSLKFSSFQGILAKSLKNLPYFNKKKFLSYCVIVAKTSWKKGLKMVKLISRKGGGQITVKPNLTISLAKSLKNWGLTKAFSNFSAIFLSTPLKGSRENYFFQHSLMVCPMSHLYTDNFFQKFYEVIHTWSH